MRHVECILLYFSFEEWSIILFNVGNIFPFSPDFFIDCLYVVDSLPMPAFRKIGRRSWWQLDMGKRSLWLRFWAKIAALMLKIMCEGSSLSPFFHFFCSVFDENISNFFVEFSYSNAGRMHSSNFGLLEWSHRVCPVLAWGSMQPRHQRFGI